MTKSDLFSSENKKYDCSLCTKSCNQRNNLLRHLSLVHGNGIKSKVKIETSDINETQKYDSETKMCRKTYGRKYRQHWCVQCTTLSKIIKKRIRSEMCQGLLI